MMIEIGTMMGRLRTKPIELRQMMIPLAQRLAVHARKLRKGDFLFDDEIVDVALEELAVPLEHCTKPSEIERFLDQGWPPVARCRRQGAEWFVDACDLDGRGQQPQPPFAGGKRSEGLVHPANDVPGPPSNHENGRSLHRPRQESSQGQRAGNGPQRRAVQRLQTNGRDNDCHFRVIPRYLR